MMRRFPEMLTVVTVCASMSCGGGETFDRNAMLVSLGDVVIVPSYATLASESVALSSATDALCAAPSATTLDAAQLAYADAYAALSRTSGFNFGPFMALPDPAEPALNFWPARTHLAQDVLNGAETISVGTLSNAQKGFPITEWLLFGDGDDATTLAAFTDPGTGARRCAYLDVIVADIVARTAALEEAWSGPDGYAHELATAGKTSDVYPLTRVALSDVLERIVFSLEDIRDMKLGAPLGLATDELAHPELVEAPFAHRSFAALADDLASIEAVYSGDLGGTDGVGLSEWMLTRNPALDAAVRAQIVVVRDAIAAFTIPLDQAIVSDREAVVALHTAIRDLHRLFGVDVSGALAVTISFNDTDGD